MKQSKSLKKLEIGNGNMQMQVVRNFFSPRDLCSKNLFSFFFVQDLKLFKEKEMLSQKKPSKLFPLAQELSLVLLALPAIKLRGKILNT